MSINVPKVKTRDCTQIEPLSCLNFNSFQYDVQVNTQRQISFVASDDHSLAYRLIQENNLIEFDGQDYIIEQINRGYVNGYATASVTALHIYTDCNRIIKYEQNTAVKTYTVQDVLNFYFSGNQLGFTTQVIGDFPKKQIEGLGGDSAFEGLAKIISTWPEAVIEHDNKRIMVYHHDQKAKHLGNRLSYGNNSDNIVLSTDITQMINSYYVVGGRDDKDKPYFPAHFVKDSASISKYGEWPGGILSDDRFHDAQAIDNYARSQFVLEPPLSVTLDYAGHGQPLLNELMRFEILETGYVTDIEVVGFSCFPYDPSQTTKVTLNSLRKTILDYFHLQRKQQKVVTHDSQQINQQIQNTLNKGLAWDWRGNE
ncbi:prophage endopeptidase tail family protein [Weissella viridescens]|jgi:hypothetical protein|uniref:prophage endopeptidase tail family protein n=1 Tax=Weissella viridescens TaxID=1629 RepID=UPI001C7D6B34|nr:prophage endopeptidase tail family protein [Weissella viridescens]